MIWNTLQKAVICFNFNATQWINVHSSRFMNFLVVIHSTIDLYIMDKSNAVLQNRQEIKYLRRKHYQDANVSEKTCWNFFHKMLAMEEAH